MATEGSLVDLLELVHHIEDLIGRHLQLPDDFPIVRILLAVEQASRLIDVPEALRNPLTLGISDTKNASDTCGLFVHQSSPWLTIPMPFPAGLTHSDHFALIKNLPVRRYDVPDPKLAQLGRQKYISLETFKKNGQGVKTPVWFVLHNDALYVYTEADSWKVKRIRNNPRVRVAVCNVRGSVKGPWLDATASIVVGDERLAADRLLDRKYFLKVIFNFLSRINRHKRAMIKIEAA
jgi:uncharacterized protein